jgi:hypothetical protein
VVYYLEISVTAKKGLRNFNGFEKAMFKTAPYAVYFLI